MKIIKIEPFVLSDKLEHSFYFSQWEYSERLICIVKITTDEGVIGWGEGYGPANVLKTGIEFFEPLIIGQDPLHVENLWMKMYLRSLDYARRGIFLSSLSAIDIALWDLKGKILGQSVSVLLGGRKRERIRPYATGLYFSKGGGLAKRLAKEALSYKEEGFQDIKMKVGLGIKEDIVNIKAVRESIGYELNLMVDSNHAFSYLEALKLSREMEVFNIGWFEEPISPEDYSGYSRLRAKSPIPIAAGECEYLRYGFLQLFKNECIDIAQPDICSAGGITEVKKIMDMGNAFGVDVVTHSWGTGIALSAAMQVLANMDVIPGRMFERDVLIELDLTESKLRDELGFPKIVIQDGYLSVPDKPGLGIEINEEVIHRYKI